MRLVRKIQLPLKGFDELVREASAEGYTFLETAENEWVNGDNRFAKAGEAFYAVFEQEQEHEQLVAVGGLNLDPYLNTPGIGRVRRIYVRSAWRRQGIGASLVAAILADARQSFRAVRLRADNAGAARLYESLGFTPLINQHATHILHFES